MIIDKIELNCNKKAGNTSVQLINDGRSDTFYNITFELFEVIDKVLINIKVNIPKNANDHKCQKEFVKTTINTAKISGSPGNFIVRTLLADFFNSIDFEPKLPMKQVRQVLSL